MMLFFLHLFVIAQNAIYHLGVTDFYHRCSRRFKMTRAVTRSLSNCFTKSEIEKICAYGPIPKMWIFIPMVIISSVQPRLPVNTTCQPTQSNPLSSTVKTVIPKADSRNAKLQRSFNEVPSKNERMSDLSTDFRASSSTMFNDSFGFGKPQSKHSRETIVCNVTKLLPDYKADCSRRGLTSVPKTLPTYITVLDLSFNKITYLSQRVFSRYRCLRFLDLSSNQISELKSYSFEGIGNLESLHLVHNNLDFQNCSRVCCNNPFKPLTNLTNLSVKLNKPSLKPISLHKCLNSLPKLEHLGVSVTDNFVFGPEFQQLKNLKSLSLSDSRWLTNLTKEFFTNLTKFPLQSLYFARCHLHTIPEGIIHTLPNLQQLDLKGNTRLGLKNATRCLKGAYNSSLRVLRLNKLLDPALRSNIIVKEEDFEPLSAFNLTELYIDWNSIVQIDISALEKLPVSLEVFKLCNNKLVYPYNSLKPLLRLINLKYLDATDQSGYLPLDEVRLPQGPLYRNQGLKVMQTEVSLTGITDRSTALTEEETEVPQTGNELIPVPPQLEKVCLTKAAPFNFSSERVTFVNSSIKTLILNSNKLGKVNFFISGLNMVEKLDLRFNRLDIQAGFFDGFSGLRSLFLHNNNLNRSFAEDHEGDMFQNQVKLEIIDLSYCGITKLFPNAFRNNTHLQKLILHSNRLTGLGCRINHMTNLSVLDLRWNSLAYLDPFATTDLQDISRNDHVIVLLFKNPLVCTCDSLEFLKWTLSLPSNITLKDFDKMQCLAQNGSTYISLSGRREIVRDLQIRCRSYTSLIVGLSLLILCSVLVVVVGLVYRYRWKFRYVYHIRLLRRFTSRPRLATQRGYDPINGNDFESTFDVFVAYADEDRHFVTVDMRELLEDENGFKMYIRDRDSIAGMEIATNITRAVNQSKVSILLFSRNFIQSKWCIYEFQMARIEGIVRRNNSLLYIMYEDVPPTEIPDDLLKAIQHGKILERPRNLENRQDMVTFWTMLVKAIREHT